jgi:hypothetical protein
MGASAAPPPSRRSHAAPLPGRRRRRAPWRGRRGRRVVRARRSRRFPPGRGHSGDGGAARLRRRRAVSASLAALHAASSARSCRRAFGTGCVLVACRCAPGGAWASEHDVPRRARCCRRILGATQFGRRQGRHLDLQVEAVEQRPGEAALVARDRGRRAQARPLAVAAVAAGAGVHRRDEQELGRHRHRLARASDRDDAVLERLAQRFEHVATELRQLVEEQHAVVRQRHLAGANVGPAAEQARTRTGVVRGAQGAPFAGGNDRPAAACTCSTARRSAGDSGGRRPGSRRSSALLPVPGGPTNSRLWPPAAATVERTLGRRVAAQVGEVGRSVSAGRTAAAPAAAVLAVARPARRSRRPASRRRAAAGLRPRRRASASAGEHSIARAPCCWAASATLTAPRAGRIWPRRLTSPNANRPFGAFRREQARRRPRGPTPAAGRSRCRACAATPGAKLTVVTPRGAAGRARRTPAARGGRPRVRRRRRARAGAGCRRRRAGRSLRPGRGSPRRPAPDRSRW